MILEELWKWFHNFRSSGWFIKNFWSLKQFLELNKGFRKNKNTKRDTWQHQGVPRVLLTSARGHQLLTSSWRRRWLGQSWPSQRWCHDDVISCWPHADVSRTCGTPWCCHMSACVFFFFRKPLLNSRNCFKLQKFIINQPELRKLWNQFYNSSKIMIYALK